MTLHRRPLSAPQDAVELVANRFEESVAALCA
jgi:hypothetical protein